MQRVPSWLFLVAVCLAAPAALGLEGQPVVEGVTFHPPSDSVRFYHARIELGPAEFAYDVTAAAVGGRADVFIARVDGALTQWLENGRVERPANGRIPAGTAAVFEVRAPWESGQSYGVRLDAKVQGAEQAFSITADATAPDGGGFPFPGWQEHRVLVLREDFGLARADEPYQLFLSDEGTRVRDWAKELRVARYDVTTHVAEEIPSQVIYGKRRHDTPKHEAVYTTCEAAFLVDVPAKDKAYYIVAYGNPEAEMPAYATDLSTRNADDGLWVENAYYSVQLHKNSGQINGFRSKTFGEGEKRGFGFDTGAYTLHYNPDVWVKGRPWTHTKGWNPPPNETIERGPVAVVTRRWGHLPEAREVEVEVVYHFFSATPYVLIESTMRIQQDLVVNALRNEEVVFHPSTEVDHTGWRDIDGEIGYTDFSQHPDLTPGLVKLIAADAPYVAMTREANGIGIASVRLSQHAGAVGDASPVVASTKTVIADYGWNFRYWSRALVYPWGDYVPDHPIVINADTYYGERSALTLFPLGDGARPEDKLAHVEALYNRLSSPLRIDHQGAGPW